MKSKFKRRTKLFSEKPQYKSIGYIRQSSNTKISISAQVEELKNAGCFAVLQEAVGRNRKENPQLKRADGLIYMLRYDSSSCRLFLFFINKENNKKVQYFEIRNDLGELLNSKQSLEQCYREFNLIK